MAAYAASNLPKQLVNSDFDHDWQNIVSQSKMTDKYNFANVDPAHGDVEISGALNGKGEASKHWVHLNGFDTAKFGWKSNQTDTRVDGRGGIVEIQAPRRTTTCTPRSPHRRPTRTCTRTSTPRTTLRPCTP